MKLLNLLIIISSLASAACETAPPEADTDIYRQQVEQELESGERYTALPGNFDLGMSRANFYELAQAQRAQDLMGDGVGTSIRMNIDSSDLPGQAVIEFYPTFDSTNHISAMPGVIYALAWAPWNRQLYADSLLMPAANYLRTLLGGTEFFTYPYSSVPTLVKVDGNRRVSLTLDPYRNERIKFNIVDLSNTSRDILYGYDLRDNKEAH